jgi:hypothetical protein
MISIEIRNLDTLDLDLQLVAPFVASAADSTHVRRLQRRGDVYA